MKFNKILKSIITLTVLLITIQAGFAAITTDAKLQYNKGVDYYRLGQFEESAKCFKQAVELDPNYIDAYYNLGSILEYMKQDEAALTVFKQIILRKPDDYEAVYKAAELSKKIGEYEKAKMYLTLIPKDTMIGQKAAILASSMPCEEENAPEIPEEVQLQPEQTQESVAHEIQEEQGERLTQENIESSNTIYTDITSPTGITSDRNGNLYVAGFSDNTIYKISQDNKKIVYIKSEKINGPIGLAMDEEGNIYIANYNKNNVLKVDTNGTISEIITDIKNPYYIYISNGLLFVSSQGSNSVIRYKI